MNIAVFGLGYVGAVSSACLPSEGHDVVGVDVNPVKVDLVNSGRTPVIEEGVAELLGDAVAAGRLRATVDCKDAIESTDLAFVCVGTPSSANGSLDLTHLRRVCEEIGEALQARTGRYVVVVRSTVLPGTTRDVVVPTLESASGRTVGDD